MESDTRVDELRDLKGQALLIVDDSPTIRRSIRLSLEPRALFAEYLEAANGIEAIRVLNQRPVDLIVCDIVMPDMDGFKFLSMIKKAPEYRDIPVIMLTGQGDVEKKVAGLDMGAADYITKPFQKDELIARVRVHLKLKLLQDKLREASITDYLTKRFNRRHFMELFLTEFERSKRHGHPLSFVILDIDHFKKINDQHGHLQGDKILVDVATLIKANVRVHDIVARYGGEEFVILLPQIGEAGATAVAEKVRTMVASNAFDGMEGKPVTISLGLVSLDGKAPGEATIDKLIQLADAALYAAKGGGRNRLEVAKPTV